MSLQYLLSLFSYGARSQCYQVLRLCPGFVYVVFLQQKVDQAGVEQLKGLFRLTVASRMHYLVYCVRDVKGVSSGVVYFQ